MAAWSKIHPGVESLTCRELAHPWTDNCLLAAIQTWVNSCVGSAGFFALLYLLQCVSTVLKKKKKVNLKEFLWTHIRSTVFGATISAGTFAIHCILRKLLGRFYRYTLVFVPAFIAGHAIFMEAQTGRKLYVNAFSNCALELWIKLLVQSKILKWNANIQTVLFMLLSSFLSSLLSRTDFDLHYFWFFIPPKASKKHENHGICFHKEICSKHIFSLFVKYSTTGLILQFIRLFISNFKNPKMVLFSLLHPKTFKLAAFLGGYVVIYQAVRCFLYRREKKYSSLHDSLAGFLAGAAFRFQPTIPIFNSAIITSAQIITEMGCQKKLIPGLPYSEIIFTFLCGLLFHSRILLKENCPQLMVYITSAVTHGMSDRVADWYENYLRNMPENFPESKPDR